MKDIMIDSNICTPSNVFNEFSFLPSPPLYFFSFLFFYLFLSARDFEMVINQINLQQTGAPGFISITANFILLATAMHRKFGTRLTSQRDRYYNVTFIYGNFLLPCRFRC